MYVASINWRPPSPQPLGHTAGVGGDPGKPLSLSLSLSPSLLGLSHGLSHSLSLSHTHTHSPQTTHSSNRSCQGWLQTVGLLQQVSNKMARDEV